MEWKHKTLEEAYKKCVWSLMKLDSGRDTYFKKRFLFSTVNVMKGFQELDQICDPDKDISHQPAEFVQLRKNQEKMLLDTYRLARDYSWNTALLLDDEQDLSVSQELKEHFAGAEKIGEVCFDMSADKETGEEMKKFGRIRDNADKIVNDSIRNMESSESDYKELIATILTAGMILRQCTFGKLKAAPEQIKEMIYNSSKELLHGDKFVNATQALTYDDAVKLAKKGPEKIFKEVFGAGRFTADRSKDKK